jgi:hypothetical protein
MVMSSTRKSNAVYPYPFEPIIVPSLYCPISSNLSPHADQIDHGIIDWMDRFQLFQSPVQREYFTRSKLGYFPSYTAPSSLAGPLQILADLTFWLFTFDDRYADETPDSIHPNDLIQLLSRVARVVEAPHAPLLIDNPWVSALRDLRLRLEEYATSTQIARWVKDVQQYLFGLMWESVSRAVQQIPSLDDYITMWINVSGMHCCTDLTDVAFGYEAPAEEINDDRILALREMTAALVGWDNDITSYNKEVFRAQRYGYPMPMNLLVVLAHESGCSIQEALDKAVVMRDSVMRQFLNLSNQVKASYASPELCRFVDGLEQWVRGYLDWCFFTNRYGLLTNPGD